MHRITSDKSRYNAVVAAIESTVLHQVSDLVLNPPATDRYASLKARLLDVFAETEQRRLNKLLGEFEFGDQKPSFILREMRNLAGTSINGEILKTLWLQRLPTNIQAILSVSSEDLDHLVIMADQIFETTSGTEMHKVSVRSNDTLFKSQISELTRQISELRSAFSDRGNSNNAYRHSPNQSRSRSRSKTPNRYHKRESSTNSKLYWNHHKWGNQAKSCTGPCDFNSKPHSGN